MEKIHAFTYGEMFDAYEDCIKNKRNTDNARQFSFDYIGNVIRLCDEINDGKYDIGKSIAFIVTFPKLREVFAADFRDRVVHHLVIRELMPYFNEYFIKESFSCMKNRGVLYGVETMLRYMCECTENYTVDSWVLKMDIKSFFMSIDKHILDSMLDEFIVEHYKDERKKDKLRELCHKIVMHHPEDNCDMRGDMSLWKRLDPSKSLFCVGKERGLPIGNLTSQIFANFYLTKLDRYIKDELGFEYYGRYVDDFVIISRDKQRLLNSVNKIVSFAKRELGLEIHPDKRYFQHYTKGVQFIGSVIKPNRVYTINRTIGSLYHKLSSVYKEASEEDLDEFVMTVNSYLGYMCHGSTYNIRKRLFKESGLFEPWKYLIVIDDEYRKINRKNKPKKLTVQLLLPQQRLQP